MVNGFMIASSIVNALLLLIIFFIGSESKPKKAKWMDRVESPWQGCPVRYCSHCGWSIGHAHIRHEDLEWKFCPNCGSPMVVQDESENEMN